MAQKTTADTAVQTPKKFEFRELNFGKILDSLLEQDTITDIEVRYGELWVVDIKKGRYKYDLENYGKNKEVPQVTEDDDSEMSDEEALASFFSNSFSDESEDEEPEEQEPEGSETEIHEDVKELFEVLDKLGDQFAHREVTGKTFNAGSPILDAETVYKKIGQLRVNFIGSSLTEDGKAALAIRKTRYGLRFDDNTILNDSYVTQDFLNLMSVLIQSGCNVLISGITGSGKTELLKFLARYIKENCSIITIEDTYEAYLKRLYPQKEVLSLKANENQTFTELLKACLRQNPDWICISEVRGIEVKTMVDSCSTGHNLISTIHSDSAMNIPWRMVDLAQAVGDEASRFFRQVHQNVNIGIYIHYYNDESGSHRQVTELCEFFLDDEGEPHSHMIYHYDYSDGTYKADKIHSELIRSKIIRNHTDTSKIKDLFL